MLPVKAFINSCSRMEQKYYVVFVERNPGIHATWDACNAQVNGFSGCRHKLFKTFEDAMKAWNEYQASFIDRTARDTTGSGAVRASHHPSTMDSGNCVSAHTDRILIGTRNVHEDGLAERVPVDEVGDESCMAPLLRMFLGLLLFYAGIRLFCRF
ncbi:uncharacterized protein LOC131225364 [Magnolia sinica]|uniref:uncharacterized protein LOC131225364 n=1 Tax=Magnolia sinica TaxID=86752 RepID=UPI0026591C75|nr:uncharacterized protein LOC131225364 [Magnolia sinica]